MIHKGFSLFLKTEDSVQIMQFLSSIAASEPPDYKVIILNNSDVVSMLKSIGQEWISNDEFLSLNLYSGV